MWPFKKKQNLADTLIQDCLEAEEMFAEKWRIFQSLRFKDDVSLSEQIFVFMEPAVDGVLKAKPRLAFGDSELIMLTLMNGIVKTGTHSALEVQDALGIPRAGL